MDGGSLNDHSSRATHQKQEGVHVEYLGFVVFLARAVHLVFIYFKAFAHVMSKREYRHRTNKSKGTIIMNTHIKEQQINLQ